MTWHQQFREKAKRQNQHQQATAAPLQVNGITAIPFDATPEDRFRLTVDVERVCEQETKTGDPCYFLNCRDAEGMTFCIVVWNSQWSRFQGRVVEGTKQTFDVRVPKGDFSAFTLA